MKTSTNQRGDDTGTAVPELLAPAGNLETAIAAYETGADAVYCGLSRFNAREMGQNFSFEELSKLAAYAHDKGKAFYITFNTLLKEQELEAAVEDLQRISSLDPHGIIVQDLGAVRILRELFPGVPIHASTQMGIHNSAGVETAARLGIERVILERQVSLSELRSIVQRSATEVEVFVHGALCCSLSGRCLFSSWIGGWSGNRGKCKQPCRRRYYTQEDGRKRAGFFFSTQDLYSLDLLTTLTEIGVASLKIEGRLKKPDYVMSVVRAYRMVLDSIAAGQQPDIKGAKAVLAESYGRRWSHGFATEEDMAQVIAEENIGVSGMRIGAVVGRSSRGLEVELRKRLRIGDRVRIQDESGGEGPAFTIRQLLQRGQRVKSVSRGRVEIPEGGELPAEGFLYRIGSSLKIPGPNPQDLQPYRPPRKIDLDIHIGSAGLSVEARDPATESRHHWERALRIEPAREHALDEETVRDMFTASRSSQLQARRIRVDLEGRLFLPLSLLKKSRREFWEELEESLPELSHGTGPAAQHLLQRLKDALPEGTRGGASRGEGAEAARPARVCAVAPGARLSGGCTAGAEALSSRSAPGREAELPHFIPEGRIVELKQQLGRLVQEGSAKGEKPVIRITDLAHFAMLAEHAHYEAVCGYPLPVTNSLAAEELRSLGARRVQAWIELDREGMEALLAAAPLAMELYCYGRPFILATRAELPAEGRIVDGRGKEFLIRRDSGSGLTYLYPPEVLRIEPLRGATEFRDLRGLPSGPIRESSFNFDVEFV
jgi:putative protease